ncbi:cuticle protein 7-like [Penaeus monodon]|uniref:cuticle protein 7-like n=1 Tax=Penaeus monodon TaxID=6687 RepID=UPI0018A79CA9|nr:cuticle protein 7-like [Penaeus monodon]
MMRKVGLVLVAGAVALVSGDISHHVKSSLHHPLDHHAAPLHHVAPVHHTTPVHHATPVVHAAPVHHGKGYAPTYPDTPPHYAFEYAVNDDYAGTHFGHSEARDGYKTEGKYFVHLPDGRVQTVTYYADETGYHPTVSYEGTAHYDAHAAVPHHAPQPAYHAPEPAYHAPEPAYHAPEPVYHAPIVPTYHA